MQDNDDEREGPEAPEGSWRKILLSGGALLGVASGVLAGVPAAVVRMEVGVDDDVDFIG